MDDKPILLSVCIPTFNRSGLLRQTLEAIFSQETGDGIEVVVSDNASTDDTQKTVKRFPLTKYFRNDTNTGLDANTLLCLQRAGGEYCWICSDDDVPLPGALQRVLAAIRQYRPDLIYLNYAGFLENERPEIVLERSTPVPDRVFEDTEEMFATLKLNHFSAMVVRRESVLPFFPLLDDYRREGFTRGYSLMVLQYALLKRRMPGSVFLGAINVAARNPFDSDYDPSTTIIDTAHQYEKLLNAGLIRKATVRSVLRETMRGSYKGILPARCTDNRWQNMERKKELEKLYLTYDRLYYCLYPFFLLHAPRWMLAVPYYLGRKVKRVYRALFNRSPL